GDPKNYLNGKEKQPQLYMVQDGDPTSLKPLTLSSVTYPGNATASAQITLINGAYNLPGLLTEGTAGNIVQFPYINVAFNQTSATLIRWPLAGSPPFEDVGDGMDPSAPFPAKLLGNPGRATSVTLNPGIYSVRVTPKATFGPIYDQFTYSFE